MAAPFDSTIGTGGDYSTLAAWLADMPADITTGGGAGNYSALLKNQTFSGTNFTLSGITTDSSHGITIGCEAGASFRDHADAATNPLRIDAAYGALLTGNNAYAGTLVISCSYVTFFGLQVQNTSVAGSAVDSTGTEGNNVYDSCLFESSPGHANSYVLKAGWGASVVKNCVVDIRGIGKGVQVVTSGGAVYDSTVVRTANQAASGVGISAAYSGVLIQGAAIFGFTTPIDAPTLDAASDYNATDQASLGTSIPGTHNLLSQTYADCFQDTGSTPANADWQIGSSSPLKDAGTTISGITLDIIGQTRSSPDIGAWEYAEAGVPATTYTLTPSPASVATGEAVIAEVTPDHPYVGTITITPTGSASTGLSAIIKTFSGSATPQTASFTPTVTGTLTLTGTNSTTLTDPSPVDVTVSAASLSATAITCTPGKTSLAVATTVSGGTAPYTKQWSYSTSRTGSYTNFGTDSLSATLSGLTYRRNYWIKCDVTDDASATTTVGPTAFATRPPHSIAIGLGGDSITTYLTGSSITANLIGSNATSSYGSIPSPDNKAVAGSSSGDWLPTADPWGVAPISGASNIYDYAAASWATTLDGVTTPIVHLMLGTNDAFYEVSAGTYRANMSTICDALVTLGYRVILSYPPFRTDDLALNDTLLLYHAQIDSLIDNVGIFQGDQDAFGIFANNPSTLLADGLHPTTAGQNAFHKLWADAISRVMEREGRDLAGGAYTSAANVRSGTDRGDGTAGTLVVPSEDDVLDGVVFDNGSTGTHVDGGGDEVTLEELQAELNARGLTAEFGAGVNVATIAGEDATPNTTLAPNVAAIKAKTDNLPSDPADASVIATSFDAVNASLTARTLIAASYATAASQTAIDGRIPAALVNGRMDCSVGAVAATAAKIKKNAALAGFSFIMTDSTNHVPTPSLTVTATRSLDGGAFAACANAVSAVSNGVYKIDLAAADLNANSVILRFTATGADDTFVTLVTQP